MNPPSVLAICQEVMDFNRTRTLATLDEIATFPNPQAVPAWRPFQNPVEQAFPPVRSDRQECLSHLLK